MPLELASALRIECKPVDDSEICNQALESVYLITLQEAGQRSFWSLNEPRVLQGVYEDEEDPKVMEAYEQVGSLLVHGNSTEESIHRDIKVAAFGYLYIHSNVIQQVSAGTYF